ncbi:hypothetical protein CHLRE_02g141766v5 [Chlamydomonas reinhardtii]|uniref:Uncharacterized protein n=1 Tax=Chlamydomonas reinhardtii TaxID=3055 RepID=A0A2K3E497_CHLRE|nr:uncharacterized protein CHLRE_02g141766v5 [Chlamydomonas reinhardtii]PNW87620.1 hypothetical protein CHLRE_02g141766v5 [Chlamydomonas reinhardtii]
MRTECLHLSARKARAFAAVVRSAPGVLIVVPCLTFILLAGAGVITVMLSAANNVNQAKANALSLAQGAAVQYRQQLLFAASPVEVFAAVVRANPSQYDRVTLRFNVTAPALLNSAPPGTITSLRLLPSGRLRLSYPPDEKLLGFDAFAGGATANSRLYADTLSVTGPVPPIKGEEAAGANLLVRRAIYVPINMMSNPDDNFGRPDIPNPLCGDPCAYNETRGTVLWGFVSGRGSGFGGGASVG